MDIHQHSGRTTRMIEEGKRLWNENYRVYLVFSHDSQRSYWREQLFKDYVGISCETPATLGLRAPEIYNLKVRGMWPTCRVLFDHFTMQTEIYNALAPLHKIIAESHRWDDPSILPAGMEPVAGVPNEALSAASLICANIRGTPDVVSIAKAIEAYYQERMLQTKQDDIQYALRKVLFMCENIRGDAMNELGSTEPDTGAWSAGSTSNAIYIEGMDSMIDELEKKLK